jgi:hypothetical protein
MDGVVISRRELAWLTFGLWLGGVAVLTVVPMLCMPLVGIPGGMAISYLLFFVAWQPLQAITQRLAGGRAALLRMVLLVGLAATLAFALRNFLVATAAGG